MRRVTVFVLIAVSISCNLQTIDAPYGSEFNAERKRVGLRPIDHTFKPKKILSKDYKKSPIVRKIKGIPVFWSTLDKPSYVIKRIHLDQNNGNILYEDDVYASGITKRGVENDITESLTARYVFVDKNYYFKKPLELGGPVNETYQKGWKYIYEYPVKLSVTSNRPDLIFYQKECREINKKEADSILRSWKLIKP
jgi:hypothetical protein